MHSGQLLVTVQLLALRESEIRVELKFIGDRSSIVAAVNLPP